MTTISIPEPLARQIDELCAAGVFPSANEFAEEAIREKLSVARRDHLALETQVLQQDLAAAGLTREMLLEEFERFRHAAHAHR
jgi:Arc/MetJ-type ribon-helix-helix transcriptional regulator